MKTQNYLCVDVKTYTHETIQENQAIFGMMEMTEQDERFEFQQVHMPLAPYRFRPDIRNPKIYNGPYFSLTRQKDGIYHISARLVNGVPRAKRPFIAFVRNWLIDLKNLFRVLYWIQHQHQL